MAILNYTTNVPTGKTVGEVQGMLAKAGVSTCTLLYAAGEPSGLAFSIETEYGLRDFQLPVNVDGVQAVLQGQEKRGEFKSLRKATGTFTSREHAARVAWRVLKDWLEAQLALIQIGMAQIDEIMLPYMVTANGRTLAQAYHESSGMQKAIEAGKAGSE